MVLQEERMQLPRGKQDRIQESVWGPWMTPAPSVALSGDRSQGGRSGFPLCVNGQLLLNLQLIGEADSGAVHLTLLSACGPDEAGSRKQPLEGFLSASVCGCVVSNDGMTTLFHVLKVLLCLQGPRADGRFGSRAVSYRPPASKACVVAKLALGLKQPGFLSVSGWCLSSCNLNSATYIPPWGKELPTLSIKFPETTCVHVDFMISAAGKNP
ncbi:hypothetical protein H8959_006888 [Pygathrix nigripes]